MMRCNSRDCVCIFTVVSHLGTLMTQSSALLMTPLLHSHLGSEAQRIPKTLCLADQAAQEDEPSEEAVDEDATPEKETEKADASAESPLDALARAAESVDSEAAAKGAAAAPSEEAAEGAPEAAGVDAAAAAAAAAADTGDFCDVQTAESASICRPFRCHIAAVVLQGFVLAHEMMHLIFQIQQVMPAPV